MNLTAADFGAAHLAVTVPCPACGEPSVFSFAADRAFHLYRPDTQVACIRETHRGRHPFQAQMEAAIDSFLRASGTMRTADEIVRLAL